MNNRRTTAALCSAVFFAFITPTLLQSTATVSDGIKKGIIAATMLTKMIETSTLEGAINLDRNNCINRLLAFGCEDIQLKLADQLQQYPDARELFAYHFGPHCMGLQPDINSVHHEEFLLVMEHFTFPLELKNLLAALSLRAVEATAPPVAPIIDLNQPTIASSTEGVLQAASTKKNSSKSNAGLIALAVIGGVTVFCCATGLAVYWYKHKKLPPLGAWAKQGLLWTQDQCGTIRRIPVQEKCTALRAWLGQIHLPRLSRTSVVNDKKNGASADQDAAKTTGKTAQPPSLERIPSATGTDVGALASDAASGSTQASSSPSPRAPTATSANNQTPPPVAAVRRLQSAPAPNAVSVTDAAESITPEAAPGAPQEQEVRALSTEIDPSDTDSEPSDTGFFDAKVGPAEADVTERLFLSGKSPKALPKDNINP